MNRKKVLKLGLIAAMLALVFAACDNGSTDQQPGNNGTSPVLATYVSCDEYGNEYKLEFGEDANMARAAKGNHYRLTITFADETDTVESTGTVTDVTDEIITVGDNSITRKHINLKHQSQAEITAIVSNDTGAITSFSGKDNKIPVDRGRDRDIVMPDASYTLNAARTGYILIDGKGMVKDGIAEIPATLRGKPVVAIGDWVFGSNSDLKILTIPASVTSIGVCALGTGLTSITFEVNSKLVAIGEGAFSGNKDLKSVTIPASVTSIGGGAFAYTGLTSITFEANSQLKSISRMAFYYSEDLTSITIPASVTSIDEYAFSMCTSLSNITFASGSQLKTIGNCAFDGANITNITIPASVTSIGDAAFAYTNIANITIPASVTSIGNSVFIGTKITSITIPAGITSLHYPNPKYIQGNQTPIPRFSLMGCTSLTSITVDAGNPNYSSEGGILYNKAKTKIILVAGGLSDNVTIPAGVTSIGEFAFYGTDNITSITIPASVTTIEQFAFYSSKLTSITIPASITYIGYQAFGRWFASQTQTINIQGKANLAATIAAGWDKEWSRFGPDGPKINYQP